MVKKILFELHLKQKTVYKCFYSDEDFLNNERPFRYNAIFNLNNAIIDLKGKSYRKVRVQVVYPSFLNANGYDLYSLCVYNSFIYFLEINVDFIGGISGYLENIELLRYH